MKVIKIEQARLKLACLKALVGGFKGNSLAVVYSFDPKRSFIIKLNDVANFMVDKMVEDFKHGNTKED